MADSSSPSPSRSPASPPTSRPSSLHPPISPNPDDDSPSVETLVSYLLQAKRSLSSMNLVLRGNELFQRARELHEEAVVLRAQTGFLRTGISEQIKLLLKVHAKLLHAHKVGKREFDAMIKGLDAANGALEGTMKMLRTTGVESVFRPDGEERKFLIDFVDEGSVERLRNAIKESIGELQAAQGAFQDDLLRFDNDIHTVRKTLKPPPGPPIPDQPIPTLLTSLTQRSHEMASILKDLTAHFDLCALAVRTTSGGAALARRRAAADTDDPVSISGVIPDTNESEEEPIEDPQERRDMLHVIAQDAEQIDPSVADMGHELGEMEAEFEAVRAHTISARAAYRAAREAFAALEDVGARLPSYAAAEAEYAERWEAERAEIGRRVQEMDDLRVFYDGYASAYDTLILEVERRRTVDDKVRAVWRKAQESVERLVEADAQERELFRQEVGDYLPTDLWEGMSDPARRWDLVPVQEPGDDDEVAESGASSAPALDKVVVAAARERLARGAGGR